MKIKVAVKEVSWGVVEIEIPDKESLEEVDFAEVYEKAEEEYADGGVYWDNEEFSVSSWGKAE